MHEDLATWLGRVGLGEYAKVFAENAVDFDVLARLNDDDLKELGLPLGHRRKLQAAIRDPGDTDNAAMPCAMPDVSPSIQAERRQLTVMFCDLVGSTELSQKLDPEDLRELLHAYQDACKAAIERYEGHIARYMGDGVLAYFGYPKAHEDDAERAVHAGRRVVEAMVALNMEKNRRGDDEVAVRVGIATGPVVAGDLIGEGASRESAVVGETPNLAARLQGIAAPNTVVVAPETQRLAGEHFCWRNLGELSLKGIVRPVVPWQVLAERAVESRFEARHGERLTPLIGRAEELAFLMRRWERAIDGEGQVMLISGEPGIGKSRLCETLAARIADAPHFEWRFQCSPYHTSSAFYPVGRHFESVAGLIPDDDAGTRLEKLERLLESSGDNLDETLPLLAALLSIPLTDRYRPPGCGAQEQKERTLQVLAHRLERISQKRPVLLIFEDLHWVDPSTVELLDRFVESLEAWPVLMLFTFRPEFQPRWPVDGYVTPLAVGRLSKRESRALVDAVAGADGLPEQVIDDIVAKTDGVPLFIEEVGQTMLGAARPDDAGTRDVPLHEVPATLQSSLMARLDQLTLGKQAAQTGAAIGREFSRALLEAASELAPPELGRALVELVDQGLLSRRGDPSAVNYQFKHALLQEAAYSSLLRAHRKPLHRRIAEALTAQSPEEWVLLSHHWEQAGELEKALDYRIKAADDCAQRCAHWEAFAQYWAALELLERLPQTPETRARHLRTFVPLTQLTGVYWRDDKEKKEGERHFEKAMAWASEEGDRASLAMLEAKEACYLVPDEALLVQAVSHADESGDKQVQAYVEWSYAGFLGQRGRFEDSHPHAKRSIALYEEVGDAVMQATVMAADGRCYLARAGKLDESLRYARCAREIAKTNHDRFLQSWLAMESEPCMYKGLWHDTIKFAEDGLPVAWDIGNYNVVLFVSAWAAIACVKLKRLEDARALLDKALEVADKRVGWNNPRAYPRIALAQLHLAENDPENALPVAMDALELAEGGELHPELGAAHRTLGEVYASGEERDKAHAAFSESLEVFGAIQSRPELAQTLLGFGRFRLQDDPDEGGRLLNRALNMFEEMDATGWIKETKSALGD